MIKSSSTAGFIHDRSSVVGLRWKIGNNKHPMGC